MTVYLSGSPSLRLSFSPSLRLSAFTYHQYACRQNGFRYFLSLDTDVFLTDHWTISAMVDTTQVAHASGRTNRAIVAPFIKSYPNVYDTNFWLDTTDTGYYVRHEQQVPLIRQDLMGVFEVCSSHRVTVCAVFSYMKYDDVLMTMYSSLFSSSLLLFFLSQVQAVHSCFVADLSVPHSNRLSFQYGSTGDDVVAFTTSARVHGLRMFVMNDSVYGFMLSSSGAHDKNTYVVLCDMRDELLDTKPTVCAVCAMLLLPAITCYIMHHHR